MTPTKFRSILNGQPRVPFHRKLNLWDIRDNVAVGVDLQMSAVLELSDLPDILLWGSSDASIHHNGLQQLLNTTPDNTTLQFVVQTREGDPSRIQAFMDQPRDLQDFPLAQMVLDAKKAHLESQFIQRRRYLLYITTHQGSLEKLPSARFTSFVNDNVHSQTRDLHIRRLKAINSVTAAIMGSLRDLKIRSRRLADQEIGQLFFEHLNPGIASKVDMPDLAIAGDRDISMRSLLTQTATRHEDGYFSVGGHFYKGVNMLLPPESIYADTLQAMSAKVWPLWDMVVTVHAVNSEYLVNKLKNSSRLTAGLTDERFKSHVEGAQKGKELKQLIQLTRESSQKLFHFSFHFLMSHNELGKVEQNVSDTLKAFNDLGSAVGVVDDMNHEDLFLGVLPNHSHCNQRKYVMHTEPLANMLPVSAPWRGTTASKMLFENPRGELVNLDMFDDSLPAKHGLVIGNSGSGKSFTVNYILTNFFMESSKNHIVVIDVGGSYRKLCQLFGGNYFDVELSADYGFNPLPVREQMLNGGEFDADELAFITLIMSPMVLDQGEVLNNSGTSIIENAIKSVYSALPPKKAPLLIDIAEALRKVDDDPETTARARHFYKNLEIWTVGRYSAIFSNNRELDINNRMIVFDLGKLSEHKELQTVYFFVIREIINSKLRDKSLRKMLVMDEAWVFFKDPTGCALIENLYRTARKFNAMVLSISQNPTDFLKTAAAEAIISNSYQKYILRLGKDHDVLKGFQLSDQHIEVVKSLTSGGQKYRDVFLKFNDSATILRLEPSALDYWICTTDADDSVKEQNIRNQHPDWRNEDVLAELVRMRTSGK